MNSAEQTVTWLITLGVLESPKKTISDPEAFLQSSLKDGLVLCRLLERLSPGSTEKVRTLKHPPPPSLSQSTQPTARPVCASVRCRSVKTDAVCCLASLSAHWSMRRFSFVGHGSSGYCLRKLRYMLTQTRKPIGCVSSAHRSALNKATAHRKGNWLFKLIRRYYIQRLLLLKAWFNLMQMCTHLCGTSPPPILNSPFNPLLCWLYISSLCRRYLIHAV